MKQGEALTVALTGATGGIGAEVAQAYAERGAQLVLVGRSASKLEGLVRSLPGTGHKTVVADLASMRETRAAARAIAEAAPKLDVLLNVAGVVMGERRETTEGVETTLAVNLLSPILLTQELIPNLRSASKSSSEARVVMTGSGAINFVKDLAPSDLQSRKNYNGFTGAYARTKAWLTLWALTASIPDVFVTVADPGGTKTDMTSLAAIPAPIRFLRPLIMHSPKVAARAFVSAGLDASKGSIEGCVVGTKKAAAPKPRFLDRSMGKALRRDITPLLSDTVVEIGA